MRYSSRISRVASVLWMAYMAQYGPIDLPAASRILLPPNQH